MELQEIEDALSRFKVCPKCNSKEGFWLGLKRNHPHVQCKCCGADFELFEVYPMGKKGESPKRSRFLRKF